MNQDHSHLCKEAEKALLLAERYGEELQDSLKLFSQLTKAQKFEHSEAMRDEIHVKVDVLLDQISSLGKIFQKLKEAEQ